MSHPLVTLGSVVIALVSIAALAAEKHSQHKPGMNHTGILEQGMLPREGGQATFAALIEVVALLENDTVTDWSAVDIDALRAHLLDMNRIMLDTTASKKTLGENSIRFDIKATPESAPSLHRMVVAHSKFIEQSRGWEIKPDLNATGAMLVITVDSAQVLDRIAALGFYGFMSLDGHHQAHHMQIATGHSH